MPELPEVETVRLGLEPAMSGKNVVRVDVRRADLRVPFPAKLNKILAGRKIDRLTRRAKYLLIHFADGKKDEDVLVVHLGMSGRMTVVEKVSAYQPLKHDHMIIGMEGGAGVVFNDARRFGVVLLVKQSGMGTHASFKSLGPEPLSVEFTGKVLREKLKGKSMAIKQALLDQAVMSGIGNIYASEALFEAGISPVKRSLELSAAKADDLVAAVKLILERAIAAGGSSLKDHRQTDGSLGYFQHGFKVYGRAGQACPRCCINGKKKHIIQKIVQSGRSTFFCANCQK